MSVRCKRNRDLRRRRRSLCTQKASRDGGAHVGNHRTRLDTKLQPHWLLPSQGPGAVQAGRPGRHHHQPSRR
ncbi:hypothetical protein HaLaN_07158 [Haematococcus lacustris]|uniref:Uncharacterized protein n=1 Tax=Haematococcus lacustris TaxID=44745 RepID=A0A699YMV8_HAELA|nr:hypothetical protein HaLaN_07158 [Haematococcus lacustris]